MTCRRFLHNNKVEDLQREKNITEITYLVAKSSNLRKLIANSVGCASAH